MAPEEGLERQIGQGWTGVSRGKIRNVGGVKCRIGDISNVRGITVGKREDGKGRIGRQGMNSEVRRVRGKTGPRRRSRETGC